MRFSRFIALAGALAFVLCTAPSVHAAGAVFKCQGAGGKVTFSDQPCAGEQKQETVKAAPPPGQVDVDAVCGRGNRSSDFSRKAGVCGQMRTCAENKGDRSCEVYCEAEWDRLKLEGVKFGPTSASCLRYNDRAGGKTWVQTRRREPSGQGYDVLSTACVDGSGQLSRALYVACLPGGTKSCVTTAPERGRALTGVPLEELMARNCGA